MLAAGSAAGRADPLEKTLASVVSVLPTWPPDVRRHEEPEGSGVVILDGRTIVTAGHVVNKATAVRVRTADGRVLPARLAGSDAATDIALLSVDEALTPIRIEDNAPKLGDRVCAVGNAFGLGLSVACGVVSGVNRAGVGFNPIEDFVQTDAAVNPGASGGALVDRDGRLVGLLSAIFTKTSDANIGVNFAVAAPLVERVAKDLKDKGRVVRPRSGLRLEPALAKDATGTLGARVAAVTAGSPAAQAGLEVGDVIVEAGGRRVRAPADFVSVMARVEPQDGLEITVVRGGQERSATLQF